MRRIQAALWIIAVVSVMAVFSHVTIRGITDTLESGLDGIRAAAEEEDYPQAKQRAADLVSYLTDKEHWLELFLKRETVASLSVNLHGLSAYANEECANDLLNEVDKAGEQVEMMEHLFFSVF